MPSDVAICNLALSNIGVGQEISNLTTERSAEALACRRYFDHVRDLVFRAFPWPFATRIQALALVEEDPNEEWAYSYRYPTDCLMFRKIQSGIRNDTRQTRVPTKIGNDSAGKLIFTNKEDSIAEYTVLVEDPEQYPPDFVSAFSFLLAAHIAPRLTGGDPFKMGDKALAKYQAAIGEAESNAANEEQAEELPESEFIRARE